MTRSISTHLDGVPVHYRVTPQHKILYTWMERNKSLSSQEHSTMLQPGVETRLIDLKSMALTIRTLHLPYKKVCILSKNRYVSQAVYVWCITILHLVNKFSFFACHMYSCLTAATVEETTSNSKVTTPQVRYWKRGRRRRTRYTLSCRLCNHVYDIFLILW